MPHTPAWLIPAISMPHAYSVVVVREFRPLNSVGLERYLILPLKWVWGRRFQGRWGETA